MPITCAPAASSSPKESESSYGIVILGLLIAGAGLGLLLPNMNVWLNVITPPPQRGRILGGLTICMFLSPFAVQPIAQQWGLQTAYLFAAGLLFAIGLLIAMGLVLTTSSGTSQGTLR
jgi:MFS family permease